MKVNIEVLDKQREFLIKAVTRLRAINADWARREAEMMESIANTLLAFRQNQMMTTMSGKSLE